MISTRPRPKSQPTSMHSRRRRRFSPLLLVGLSVPLVLGLIAGAVFILPRLGSHAAAAANPNCTLIVPANPLSAQGLATPYQLFAPDAAANGPCNENNAAQGAFVQGAIIDPATGKISIYNPLVIDKGTTPLVAPVAPQLPQNAVVALWFGFDGNNLTLQGTNGNTLRQGRCVTGFGGTLFGEFNACNAQQFFTVANRAIRRGQLTVPPLGTAKDGKPCPSVRDFSVVDMDQSDNVTTLYLVNANGQTAQKTAANTAAQPNTTPLGNPSDNRLLSAFIAPALGCTPMMAPDLADNGAMTPALPLNELQAAAGQAAPVALVPAGDPMTLLNNNPNLGKTNAYRRQVDQPPAFTLNANQANPAASANTTTYCQNLINTGIPRIQGDMGMTQNFTSPAPAAATNLFTFLGMRLNATLGAGGLNCTGLLNIQNPVNLTMDGNGVVTAVTFATPAAGGNGGGNGTGTGTGTMTTPTTTAATPTAAAGGGGTTGTAATGTVTLNLQPGSNALVSENITVANTPNQQVNVNFTTGGCGATPVVTQPENTGGDNAFAVDASLNAGQLQQLNAAQTLPNNLFVAVTQNGTALGCGIVKVSNNGLTGTATLGVIQ